MTIIGSNNKINCQKSSSAQFRWRRRKRRSKAQYPEMSQYLVPIDEGDEIQHLGRTLECTLCGLRGKRCHLTLHFKAKHSEVIDLHIPGRNMNSGGATQITNTGIKIINFEFIPISTYIWLDMFTVMIIIHLFKGEK